MTCETHHQVFIRMLSCECNLSETGDILVVWSLQERFLGHSWTWIRPWRSCWFQLDQDKNNHFLWKMMYPKDPTRPLLSPPSSSSTQGTPATWWGVITTDSCQHLGCPTLPCESHLKAYWARSRDEMTPSSLVLFCSTEFGDSPWTQSSLL